MIINHKIFIRNLSFISIKIFLIAIGCLTFAKTNAQQKPPRPMSVMTYQNLNFGSVIQGSTGGTVIIYPNGTRSSTGDLILPAIGLPGSEAIFEIKAPPGTLITIILSNTTLTGNGYSMNVTIGPTDPVSPFITTHQQAGTAFVHVGATLSIGNPLQNPAGNYSGSFSVTFIQQ